MSLNAISYGLMYVGFLDSWILGFRAVCGPYAGRMGPSNQRPKSLGLQVQADVCLRSVWAYATYVGDAKHELVWSTSVCEVRALVHGLC